MKKKLWKIVKDVLISEQNKSIQPIQRLIIKQLHNNNNNNVKKRIISCYVACHISTVRRWISRDEIQDMPRTGKPAIYSKSTHLSLIGFYCQTRPLSECGRWTLRLAEKHLEKHADVIEAAMSKSSIHRILQANT